MKSIIDNKTDLKLKIKSRKDSRELTNGENITTFVRKLRDGVYFIVVDSTKNRYESGGTLWDGSDTTIYLECLGTDINCIDIIIEGDYMAFVSTSKRVTYITLMKYETYCKII